MKGAQSAIKIWLEEEPDRAIEEINRLVLKDLEKRRESWREIKQALGRDLADWILEISQDAVRFPIKLTEADNAMDLVEEVEGFMDGAIDDK